MDKRRLTAEEWAQARARWEGNAEGGFGWLASETRQAWGVEVTRQAVQIRARREGWAKGGPPSGLLGPARAGKHEDAPTPAASGRSAPKRPADGSGQQQTEQHQQAQQQQQHRPRRRSGPTGLTPHLSASGRRDAEQVSDIGEDGRVVEPVQGQAAGSGPCASGLPLPGAVRPWIPAPVRAAGRTKYREEFADEMLLFFSVDAAETLIDAPDGGAGRIVPPRFPTFERFATNIGVTSKTLQNWATETLEDGAERHPDFASAYARARDMQCALVIEGGMCGVWADRFALLAAKNLAHWKDKVEIAEAKMAISREELERTFIVEMALAHERQREVVRARLFARGVIPA